MTVKNSNNFSFLAKIALILVINLFALAFISCGTSTEVNGNKIVTPFKLDSSIKKGQLDNGMDYYIKKYSQPNNRIALRLVVKAGSCQEEEDQKGVAHFIEHLAFNGTEHFEKNSIIDFFELAGMNFGADLNAYTNFEETVYQLEIPADNPEYLEKAVLILRDWACAVSFDNTEIEKERGVVTEEWRNSIGLNGRIRDNYFPFMLKDSRFEKRLPIGDMNVIKTIKKNRIVDFYKKWYRPDLMSVIVVGDTDTKKMEDVVKKIMSDIPASEEKEMPKPYRIPHREDKDIFIMKDSEQSYTVAELSLQVKDFEPLNTEESFRKQLTNNYVSAIFTDRLRKISLSGESGLLGANLTVNGPTHKDSFATIAFTSVEGSFPQAFKRILDEYDRLVLYGITPEEFQTVQNVFLNSAEYSYTVRLKRTSMQRTQDIVDSIVADSTCVSDEDVLKITKKYLKRITIDEINQAARELLVNRGNLLFVVAPTKDKSVPSKTELMNIWKNHSNPDIQAYGADAKTGAIMRKPATKSPVITKERADQINTNVYTLENGAKIVLQKTRLVKNSVEFSVVSKGGTLLYKEEDLPSALVATDYALLSGISGMDLTKLNQFLSEKQIGFDITIRDNYEEMKGSAPANEVETLLQTICQFMTNPQFNDGSWNYIQMLINQNAAAYHTTPDSVFTDKITELIEGKSFRNQSIDSEFAKRINQKRAEEIYKERFGNAADFTFIFVGDFDEAKLLDLCCYYIGNLPGDKSKLEDEPYAGLHFPSKITKATVRKGKEQQGAVFIAFKTKLPDEADPSLQSLDADLAYQLEALLDIKLREGIREEKGGSYGVSVYIDIEGNTKRNSLVMIQFNCEPSREKELTQETLAIIRNLQNSPASDTDISKINEIYRRDKEKNLTNNSWWLKRLKGIFAFEREPVSRALNTTLIPEETTGVIMQQLAKKYMPLDNYVVVYLEPEK